MAASDLPASHAAAAASVGPALQNSENALTVKDVCPYSSYYGEVSIRLCWADHASLRSACYLLGASLSALPAALVSTSVRPMQDFYMGATLLNNTITTLSGCCRLCGNTPLCAWTWCPSNADGGSVHPDPHADVLRENSLGNWVHAAIWPVTAPPCTYAKQLISLHHLLPLSPLSSQACVVPTS